MPVERVSEKNRQRRHCDGLQGRRSLVQWTDSRLRDLWAELWDAVLDGTLLPDPFIGVDKKGETIYSNDTSKGATK